MKHRFAVWFFFLISGLFMAGDGFAGNHEFYRGKTVRLVVGYAPGGGYDFYARTIARYMGKHIPGNPAFVVENMPGAGSSGRPPITSIGSPSQTA